MAAGQLIICSSCLTLVRVFLKVSLFTSITGLKMKLRHQRMSSSTHTRFRKLASTVFWTVIISLIMI